MNIGTTPDAQPQPPKPDKPLEVIDGKLEVEHPFGPWRVTEEKLRAADNRLQAEMLRELAASGFLRSKIVDRPPGGKPPKMHVHQWAACRNTMDPCGNAICLSCVFHCYGGKKECFKDDDLQERKPTGNKAELLLSLLGVRDWRVYTKNGSRKMEGCCDCAYCSCPMSGR